MAKKKAKKRNPKPPQDLPENLISKVMRAMGSKGGKVRGLSKARTSEQARAAANARWDKEKESKRKDEDVRGT